MISTQKKWLHTFRCTILLSGYKKNHSCSRGLSCHGLTCACVRAIWEFPSPTRTPSLWPCYLKWMTCLWFPERQAGACKDMTNIYSVKLLCKAARPWLICNMPTELWTSSGATHISWPRSCAFLLPRRSRSERLLFSWLDGPSHYSSKQRSLSFYRRVGRKGGIWIRAPGQNVVITQRRK